MSDDPASIEAWQQQNDIVARLREFDADLTKEIADGEHGEDGHLWVIPFDCILQAADEIERLREEHRAACEDRDAYRSRYHRALAASVWKPGTRWRTYVNPQRSDGLFVATVGDLVRPYQAVPDGCLSLRFGLPHDEAEAVVRILNEWTELDAARAKEEQP